MPSFYQDELFQALVATRRLDVRVIYDHPLTADRHELGWTEHCSGYDLQILSPPAKLLQALRVVRNDHGRLHVINGIWAEPVFAAVAIALGISRGRFAIYAEAPDETEPRSRMKRYARYALGQWIAHRAVGMLAVSHYAADFYRALGFVADQIYPFGYFRNTTFSPTMTRSRAALDIVFVGRFVHRKGTDILLEAMLPVFEEFPTLRLSMIGDGPEFDNLTTIARDAGVHDRVVFEGVLSARQMHSRLTCSDLLVLPSRWDGWGLVVNEALCAGIPVIVSDRCGAADLVRNGVNGYVFCSENVRDLRRCIRLALSNNRAPLRRNAAETGSALALPVIAEYVTRCLEHMAGMRPNRPTPPWSTVLSNLEAGR